MHKVMPHLSILIVHVHRHACASFIYTQAHIHACTYIRIYIIRIRTCILSWKRKTEFESIPVNV